METPLKTGFAQSFSCCPKNLSCPKFGGPAAPLGPPAHTPMIMSPLSRQQSFPLRVKRICPILASLHLCPLVLSFPCQPDFSLTVSDPTAELSIIFATVYKLRSDTSRDVSNHDRSNHDRRIMSEYPGVYIAMKSAVNQYSAWRKS